MTRVAVSGPKSLWRIINKQYFHILSEPFANGLLSILVPLILNTAYSRNGVCMEEFPLQALRKCAQFFFFLFSLLLGPYLSSPTSSISFSSCSTKKP